MSEINEEENKRNQQPAVMPQQSSGKAIRARDIGR